MAIGNIVTVPDVLVVNCYRLMGTGLGETPFHIITVTDASLAGKRLVNQQQPTFIQLYVFRKRDQLQILS